MDKINVSMSKSYGKEINAQFNNYNSHSSAALSPNYLEKGSDSFIENVFDDAKETYNSVKNTVSNWWDDVTETVDGWFDDVGANVSPNVKSLIEEASSWWDDVTDWWNSDFSPWVKEAASVVWDDIKSAGATIAVGVQSLVEGILEFGESIVDFGALLGTGIASIGTGIYDGYQAIRGAITDEEWSSVTKQMWNGTKGFVSNQYVSGWFDSLYQNTGYGQWLAENAIAYDGVRDVASGIGYVSGVVVLSVATFGAGSVVATGGTATAASAMAATTSAQMAATAAVAGIGKGTQNAWADGAGILEGLGAGTLSGIWEGCQFYVGGKIGSLNLFGADGVLRSVGSSEIGTKILNGLSRVVLDGIDGGVEGFVAPIISSIYKDGYYDESGNYIEFSVDQNIFDRYSEMFDDNGGWKNVLTQASVGSFTSLLGEAFDLGKHFSKKPEADVSVDKKLKTDAPKINISEQELQSKIDTYNELLKIRESDEYLEYVDRGLKGYAGTLKPEFYKLEERITQLQNELSEYGKIMPEIPDMEGRIPDYTNLNNNVKLDKTTYDNLRAGAFIQDAKYGNAKEVLYNYLYGDGNINCFTKEGGFRSFVASLPREQLEEFYDSFSSDDPAVLFGLEQILEGRENSNKFFNKTSNTPDMGSSISDYVKENYGDVILDRSTFQHLDSCASFLELEQKNAKEAFYNYLYVDGDINHFPEWNRSYIASLPRKQLEEFYNMKNFDAKKGIFRVSEIDDVNNVTKDMIDRIDDPSSAEFKIGDRNYSALELRNMIDSEISLKNSLLNSVENINDPLLKTRKLYIELNKKLHYDMNFFKADDVTKSQILNKTTTFENIGKGNKVICKGWSELFRELLIDSGFDEKNVRINTSGIHRWVEVDLGNGYIIHADATEAINNSIDLATCKAGFGTSGFICINNETGNWSGVRPKSIVESESNKNIINSNNQLLLEIDQYLGYAGNEGYFADEVIKAKKLFGISRKFSDKMVERQLDAIFNIEIPPNIDGYEVFVYYKKISDNLFGSNNNPITLSTLYLKTDDGIEPINYMSDGSRRFQLYSTSFGIKRFDNLQDLRAFEQSIGLV